MSVLSYFCRGLRQHPDRTFLVDQLARRTYRESADRIRLMAAELRRRGCHEDDKIAIISANSAVAFECMLAVYAIGAVFVSVNAGTNEPEKLSILNGCDASVICYQEKFREEAGRLQAGSHVRSCMALDDVSQAAIGDAKAVEDVFSPNHLARFDAGDRLVSLYGSGGTTGTPKGIMFTNRVWDTMTANFLVGVDCRDAVFLMVPPFTHGAGSVAIPMLSLGGTIVIHDKFDSERVLRTMEEERVTHIWLPPTAVYSLLESPWLDKFDYSSLRMFLYSAAPMSVSKLERCLEVFGPVMAQVYGQTEAPMSCTVFDQRDHLNSSGAERHRLKSCGRPSVFTPVEIMDDAGNLLVANQMGELVVRGDLVMAGYYKNPAATDAAMKDGWLRTGDVGYKDDDDFVYIVDRKRLMIISGGYNIYPAEIEQILTSHPAIVECAVIGVPDDKWGEAVKAVVEVKAGSDVDEAELVAFCRSRLNGVKTPKSIEIRERLPRTAVGKVDKRGLRDEYWKNAGRRI